MPPEPPAPAQRPPRPPITFNNTVGTALRKYFHLDGRASRPEYWLLVLFNDVLCLGLLALGAVWSGFGALAVVSYLGLLIPLFTAGIRRLHDTGRSGHWYWLAFLPFGSLVLIVFLAGRSQPHPNRYGP
ncbi:DUF805 domain-containing protein [Saccharothrix sp. ALI-22-I]|uniref:DUF805 domain-containing protein n=1 Tax=Saccharothrix sp. ALI-22-I TaxID=1933778 RepID=UPI0015C3E101|nr:DUF805 domain-containing protein [Saccharothrix sp. ALI-22-I]